MGERRCIYRALVGNLRERPLGRPMRRWEDSIKLNLQEVRWVMNWIDVVYGFSHDVRPSVNCRTHERTFFTSVTPSLHVSLNC